MLLLRSSIWALPDTAWVRHYAGPGAAHDYATDVALDAAGNVYSTGATQPGGSGPFGYLTVSYSPSGDLRWVKDLLSGPGTAQAIAIDSAGAVYVTGMSSEDCVTLKYRGDGEQCWLRRYNGPGNGSDWGEAIAAGLNGKVCVAGRVYDTIDLSYDFLTIMYDTGGAQKWFARYNGPAQMMDIAFGVAIDQAGNVYTGGSSDAPDTRPDYALVKYDSLGHEKWVARYEGPGNDEMQDMTVDASGNVYLTGIGTTLTDTCEGYVTVKFDSEGDLCWVADYQATSRECDWSYAVATDAEQNVYVTGMAWADSASGYDCTTIKYDSRGRQLWVARWRVPDAVQNWGADLAFDRAGNVYVTGGATADGLHYDVITLKYSGAGELLWSVVYSRPGRGGAAVALELDGNGDVIVAGQTWGPDSSYDLTVVKYTGTGALMEAPVTTAPRGWQGPSVLRGTLVGRGVKDALVDCAGREVADLHPGPNDVSHLAPGVYFVREGPQAIRKVVIAR